MYVTYKHWESNPEGLGVSFVEEIHHVDLKNWKELLDKIKVVSEDGEAPTRSDIEALREMTDLRVSGQSTSDWYCLTRKMQGCAGIILKSGYMYGQVKPIADVLKIEDMF